MKMIVAHGANREIGIDGDLPWRIKEDLQYFSRVTKEASFLISGRKTLASIPDHQLPGRDIVVISSGYTRFHNEKVLSHPDDVFALPGIEDAVIIGGQTMYEHFLPFCDELLITQVKLTVNGADTYFPYYEDVFTLKEIISKGTQGDIDYSFQRWLKAGV